LISKDYLADMNEWEEQSDYPVAFVSRYAAEAFCKWLKSEYSEILSGFTVRLPTEWEWEYAAIGNGRHGESNKSAEPVPVTVMQPGNYSLRGMGSGLWEWCDDWFFPNSLLFYDIESVFNGTVAPVRGGSWANNEKIEFTARGHQPPSWCTPFLGFRPILFPDRQ
jgi:formylglycine-generating enzyme required for sulfatase activity